MLFHQIVEQGAAHNPKKDALRLAGQGLSYAALGASIDAAAAAFQRAGLDPGDRVAIYLPKAFETVTAMFATSRAGGVFVPINPVFKGRQAAHILRDSGARFLITSMERWRALAGDMPADVTVLLVDGDGAGAISWNAFVAQADTPSAVTTGEDDLAALLYTSGSTGLPKGVMLSHRNVTVGAQSVSQYLDNRPEDRILCVLPLSFDYGLSQLSTALLSGATAVLLNHLFPQDVITALEQEKITGLGCVPPLWLQLLGLDWPASIAETLHYVTSSGGAMPRRAVEALKDRLPHARIFLMYGLTEAFRSTYLDPALIDARPDSIGKAIPNARIDVVTPDGRSADPDEPGELVHSGPLVAQGYWNDPERTAARFRPLPAGFGCDDPAVWSGDIVRRDADGFLYFVERHDNMIKTSGYRVSPTEVEDIAYEIEGVAEAAAIGVKHGSLGQAIVLVVSAKGEEAVSSDDILAYCRQQLPGYMVPRSVVVRDDLPRNPNGKIDRNALQDELGSMFEA